MKRLFIGVKFSDDVNDYFQTSQLMVEKYCERANYTRYDNFHLTMHCYVCSISGGVLHLNAHNDAKWVSLNELKNENFVPADVLVVNKLTV